MNVMHFWLKLSIAEQQLAVKDYSQNFSTSKFIDVSIAVSSCLFASMHHNPFLSLHLKA